jgi:hypothetical protein
MIFAVAGSIVFGLFQLLSQVVLFLDTFILYVSGHFNCEVCEYHLSHDV